MMLRPKDLCPGSGTRTFLEAMQSGKVHLARFVLDALDGRIVNGRAENGRTLLMYAASLRDGGSRAKFTLLLLEKGADVNGRDEHGRTALSLACQHGHLDSVKLLVQFNADPELADAWGNSALMYAACGGHGPVLDFLVRAFKKLGLRLDRTNHAGHSAAQVADFFGHDQCARTLSGKKLPASPTDDTLRWPDRLPRQVLERFSSRTEDVLPALVQRHLRISDQSGPTQNPALKDEVTPWGFRATRKQSYQGDVQETHRSAKRASLQDEKPLGRFYSTVDEQPPAVPRSTRPGGAGPIREELEPDRIRSRSSGLSGLGTRLLRRLTAPEFLRNVRDCPAKGRMFRSETFPLSHGHQRVNSQPSVDSISAVRISL